MTHAAASLDHLVVNALLETDAAAACFTALGFTLTPRGYHSLGSLNHLMMFGDHYLELVGLPVGTDTLRREILESPLGIDGLVFKTDDADLTYARLTESGFKAEAARAFSRPVEIDGQEQLARFKTTRLSSGELEAGRVYFCEHLTPEFVFRPEWATHPNGATGLAELVIIDPDPGAAAARYARVAGTPPALAEAAGSVELPGFALRCVDMAGYRARYGELCVTAGARSCFFGALVVRVANLADLRTRLDALASAPGGFADTLAHAPDGRSSLLLLKEFNTLIEFIGEFGHVQT